MKILAVLSQKGGTGKSHTVRSIAVAGILDGRKVAKKVECYGSFHISVQQSDLIRGCGEPGGDFVARQFELLA